MEFELIHTIWDFLTRLFDYPIVRLFSLVVSPILAILAFIWNRNDRKELVAQGQQLGRSRAEQSKHTRRQARDRRRLKQRG